MLYSVAPLLKKNLWLHPRMQLAKPWNRERPTGHQKAKEDCRYLMTISPIFHLCIFKFLMQFHDHTLPSLFWTSLGHLHIRVANNQCCELPNTFSRQKVRLFLFIVSKYEHGIHFTTAARKSAINKNFCAYTWAMSMDNGQYSYIRLMKASFGMLQLDTKFWTQSGGPLECFSFARSFEQSGRLGLLDIFPSRLISFVNNLRVHL